jgi:hypothetical protein
MTPEHRRTLVNAVLAVVVAVGVWGLVTWLRTTVPETTTEGLTVETTDVSPDEVLLCDQLVEGGDDLPVPGRAVSGEVLACPVAFDGRLVTYVGEVVGDVLRRDGGSWLLVNDDAYALVTGPLGGSVAPSGLNSGLAVWVPSPLDQRVDTPGRSGLRGDVIEVTGVVLRADPADGGGLTIRASELDVVAGAVAVETPVHWRQVGAAGVLAIAALALAYRDRRRAG